VITETTVEIRSRETDYLLSTLLLINFQEPSMLKIRINQDINCHECPVNYLCLPGHLSVEEIDRINSIITKLRIVSRNEMLFQMEDKLHNIYAVYSGFCKSYWIDESGIEHIDSFYLPGDIIGLESISNRTYSFSTVALRDTKLCVIPLDALLDSMLQSSDLLDRMIRIMSYKMQTYQSICMTTNASQRIADFILNILFRSHGRSVLQNAINLSISQLDIANFLGMAHETVNRILKKFQQNEIIRIEKKTINIINIEYLKKLGTSPHHFNQMQKI